MDRFSLQEQQLVKLSPGQWFETYFFDFPKISKWITIPLCAAFFYNGLLCKIYKTPSSDLYHLILRFCLTEKIKID